MKRTSSALLIASLHLSLIPNVFAENQEYPRLKAGDWQVTSEIPMMKQPMTTIICIDDATQQKLFEQSKGMKPGACEKPIFKKSGAIFTTESTCTIAGSTTLTRAEITLQGDTAYTQVITMTSENKTQTLNGTGTYLGACKDGRKPGDMQMSGVPGGGAIKLNAADLAKMAKQLEGMTGK